MEIKNQKTGIFGIQKSGKTYFAKNLIKEFKHPLVLQVNEDDCWEEDVKRAYVYKIKRKKGVKIDYYQEFEFFIDKAYDWVLEGKIDAIFIDEADLFFRNNYDLNGTHLDLVLNHRHLKVALVYMTRRPQDIPTKIVESCLNLVIFKLEGKNAVDRFNDIHPKIPELIGQLNFKKHDFVIKEIGVEPYIHKPI